MKYTSTAAVLAALGFAAWPSAAPANPPRQCGPFCLLQFSKIHQHGPLFNYGPYYGYPPFEPYGPWNAYLQYNPWYSGDGSGGRGGLFGGGGLGGRLGHGCRGCGFHAHWLKGGWFRGDGCLGGCRDGHFAGWLRGLGDGRKACGHGLFKGKSDGCSTCAAVADPRAGDAATRYAGVGDPRDSAVFYAGFPTLDPNAAR